MGLLVVDGFDHYATGDLLKKWSEATSYSIEAGGRGGGNCMRRGTNTNQQASIARRQFGGAKASVGVGAAFSFSTLPTANGSCRIIALHNAANATQVTIALQSNGAIAAYRGVTTALLGESAPGVIPANAYMHIEVYVVFSATVGSVEVRVGGATTAALSVSGVSTVASGSAEASQLVVLGNMTSSSHGVMSSDIDDLYAWDTSGSVNNTWMGDCNVKTLFPNGAGTHQSWTPSAGTDHAALIDETAPNTTDYLTGGAAGTKETATLQNLTGGGTIFGIQVNAALAKTDAGASSTKNLIRSGTTEATGAVSPLSTSYRYIASIHETDPATGAPWLLAGINGLEAGVEVVD